VDNHDFTYHDARMWQFVDRHINFAVKWFLASSYSYYHLGMSFITDHAFDALCKRIYNDWQYITHAHRGLITKDDLIAGTAYALRSEQYPPVVKSMAQLLLRDTDPDNRSYPGIFVCTSCLDAFVHYDVESHISASKNKQHTYVRCCNCTLKDHPVDQEMQSVLAGNELFCIVADRALSRDEYIRRFGGSDVVVVVRPLPTTLPYALEGLTVEDLSSFSRDVAIHKRHPCISFF